MGLLWTVAWVLLTLRHASRTLEVVPEHWCSPAIAVGILISSLCSSIVKEERRLPWNLKLPAQAVFFMAFLLLVDFSREYKGLEDAKHLYVHFSFWGLLFVQATDISQVLLPMFLLVRPVQCCILVLALKALKIALVVPN